MKFSSGVLQLQSCLVCIIMAAILMTTTTVSAQGLQRCCEKINSDSICNQTCIETLAGLSQESTILTSTQIQALSSACSPSYTSYWTCLKQNLTINGQQTATTDPAPSLPGYYYCCSESQNEVCRTSCQQSLSSSEPWVNFISELSVACGPPPSDRMWTCLLEYVDETSTTTVNPNVIPSQPPYADWARVQCCYKAVADECRDSCLDLYSGQVSSSSWTTFQLDCIHRPSENIMSTCLSDVSAPCKLGCSGMQFCEGFNNRPLQSFRHCTTSADRMAKSSYHSWVLSGIIPHPLITLFVDRVDECLADMWKAVACITHVQPCHPTTHVTQICRDDCMELLSTCSQSQIAPQAVCDIIAPANTQKYCVSLSHFIEPSEYSSSEVTQVTNPCSPNPCAEGYFCAINHLCQSSTPSCTPYNCQPGCLVGDRPSFVVSEGSGVRVSLVTQSDAICYGYFNCSSDSVALTSDSGLAGGVPALGGTAVWAGYKPVYQHCEEDHYCHINGTIFKHQVNFRLGCNFCTCYHGRVTCTERKCSESNETEYLNCDCPTEHRPVCSNDGKTIPNSCFASCLGYTTSEYRHGDCSSTDPCGSSEDVCESGSKCLPHRRVCVTPGQSSITNCKQFTCESVTPENCLLSDPVCDSNNIQHASLCSFLKTQGHIDYFGFCKPDCAQGNSEHVCGVNGETYSTHCHAENAYVAIDYSGQCVSTPGDCSNVVCPSLPPDCAGVLAWDSCCPKCGAYMTVLFDDEVLKRNIFALGRIVLSSDDILRKLRYHISSLQCNLFGHISLDGSLSIWVTPSQNTPNLLLINACNAEAVKLTTFINNHTPMLASDPYLSHLIAADVTTAKLLSSPEVTTTDSSVSMEATINISSGDSSLHRPGGLVMAALVSLVCLLTLWVPS